MFRFYLRAIIRPFVNYDTGQNCVLRKKEMALFTLKYIIDIPNLLMCMEYRGASAVGRLLILYINM
jgi:deoxycytidine triphosphate deaminase